MNALSKLLGELEIRAEQRRGSAINIIKADHKKVEMLFQEFEKTEKDSMKQQILTKIIDELTIHATFEEELVYPLLDRKEHSDTQEALQEHHVVKLLIAELSGMSAAQEEAQYKVKVLCELVKHHVKEEESELLPALKLSGINQMELGKKILARKEQLKGKPAPKSEARKEVAQPKGETKTASEKVSAKPKAERTSAAKSKVADLKAAKAKKAAAAKKAKTTRVAAKKSAPRTSTTKAKRAAASKAKARKAS
ncbi:MAG TPA: hemerythrin domain-containing protein [Chroococcales cyanobacterium]